MKKYFLLIIALVVTLINSVLASGDIPPQPRNEYIHQIIEIPADEIRLHISKKFIQKIQTADSFIIAKKNNEAESILLDLNSSVSEFFLENEYYPNFLSFQFMLRVKTTIPERLRLIKSRQSEKEIAIHLDFLRKLELFENIPETFFKSKKNNFFSKWRNYLYSAFIDNSGYEKFSDISDFPEQYRNLAKYLNFYYKITDLEYSNENIKSILALLDDNFKSNAEYYERIFLLYAGWNIKNGCKAEDIFILLNKLPENKSSQIQAQKLLIEGFKNYNLQLKNINLQKKFNDITNSWHSHFSNDYYNGKYKNNSLKITADELNTLQEYEKKYMLPIIEFYNCSVDYLDLKSEKVKESFKAFIDKYPQHYLAPSAYYMYFHSHSFFIEGWKTWEKTQDFYKTDEALNLADSMVLLYPYSSLTQDIVNEFANNKVFVEKYFDRIIVTKNRVDFTFNFFEKDYEFYSKYFFSTVIEKMYYDNKRRFSYDEEYINTHDNSGFSHLINTFPFSKYTMAKYIDNINYMNANNQAEEFFQYSQIVLNNPKNFPDSFIQLVKDNMYLNYYFAGYYDSAISSPKNKGDDVFYDYFIARAYQKSERWEDAEKAIIKILEEGKNFYINYLKHDLIGYYLESSPEKALEYFIKYGNCGKTKDNSFFIKNQDFGAQYLSDYYFRRGYDSPWAYENFFIEYNRRLGYLTERSMSIEQLHKFIETHKNLKAQDMDLLLDSLSWRYAREFQIDTALTVCKKIYDLDLRNDNLVKLIELKKNVDFTNDTSIYKTAAYFYHKIKFSNFLYSNSTTYIDMDLYDAPYIKQNEYLDKLSGLMRAKKLFDQLTKQSSDVELKSKSYYSSALCSLWLAECRYNHYSSHNNDYIPAAVRNFMQCYETDKNSSLADDALYWAGYFDDKLKQDNWQLIKNNYPNGDMVEKLTQ